MTVLHLADEGEAADLAAFLSRLIHYDRSAAVRLQAAGTALAVFGRPPSFEVLAIRAVRLAKPYEDGLDVTLDVTVSAGELLESVDESAATAAVPAAVTGPPWAGVLPPRGGWRAEPGLPAPDALRAMVGAAVAEFRSRTQELAPEQRTRAELDRIGGEIWSRTVGDTRSRCGPRTRHSRSASYGPRTVRAARRCSRRARGYGCARRSGRSPYGGRDLGHWPSASAELQLP